MRKFTDLDFTNSVSRVLAGALVSYAPVMSTWRNKRDREELR